MSKLEIIQEADELLEKAHMVADWYEEKDIMFDDFDRAYVMIDVETDHSDDSRSEFKKCYL